MSLTVLDRLNLAYIWLKTAYQEYSRFCPNTISVSGHESRIFYGFDTLPTAGEKAFGGIIKVQDLQKIFPNVPHNPTILYFVSSALPPFAFRMARCARKAGVKIVLNQNGVAYPGWYGNGWKEANGTMRKILHHCDQVIYQSDFCKMAADKFLGEKKGKSVVLYNPVDTDFFFREPNATNQKEPIKLLLAGSHQSFYRVRVALEALKLILSEVPSTRLIIAGRCSWERKEAKALSQLTDLISQLGLEGKVDISGSYTQSEAPGIFQQAHILIHTKYNDPCPRLVVEAMSCGLPVVYSATGGVPELVGTDAGRGVVGPISWEKEKPPEGHEIAREVLNVMGNLDRYSLAARKRAVGNFDVHPWLERHREIFTKLLQEK